MGTLVSAGNVTLYAQSVAGLIFTENATTGYKGYNLGYFNNPALNPLTTQITPYSYANLHVNQLTVDGGITGASISGVKTFTVSLNNGNGTAVVISTTLGTSGSYMIKVIGGAAGNAGAVFLVSKSLASSNAASTCRMVSSLGNAGEEIGLQWGSGISPYLYHTSFAATGGIAISYTVTVI